MSNVDRALELALYFAHAVSMVRFNQKSLAVKVLNDKVIIFRFAVHYSV